MSRRKNVLKCLLFVVLGGVLIVAGKGAQAQETSHYRFFGAGSACQSHGSWTDQASRALDGVIKIAQDLKCDKNRLDSFLAKLQAARSAISEQSTLPARNSANDHAEAISTLKLGAQSDPTLQSDAAKVLLGTNISAAGNAALITGGALTGGLVYHPFLNFLARVSGKATSEALSLVDGIFTSLPNLNDCLYDSPGIASHIIVGTIDMAASLASRKDAKQSQLAQTMTNLMTFMSDQRLRNTIKNAMNEQFMTSITCLLESLTQNYCSTWDVKNLLEDNIKSSSSRYVWDEKGDLRIDLANPMAGYYMLVQPVPKISNWLQQVLFGSLPKSKEEADFKTQRWMAIVASINEGYELYGKFKSDAAALSNYTDKEDQRTHLLRLIRTLVNGMMANKSAENFLIMGQPADNLPYMLLGIDVPKEVTSQTPPMAFEQWVYDGGKFKTGIGFDDPEDTVQKLSIKLASLIEASRKRAGDFFIKFLVSNQPNIVTKSLEDPNMNVYESMQLVRRYLQVLAKKLEKADREKQLSYADPVIVGDINLTIGVLSQVIKSYEEARTLAKAKIEDMTEAQQIAHTKKLKDAYKKIVETAYEQFGLLLEKDSYLPVKMASFVKVDYGLSIRLKTDYSAYTQQLLASAGYEVQNLLMSTHEVSPALLSTDISRALYLNGVALHMFESVFNENLVPYIRKLKMLANNESPTNTDLSKDSWNRLAADVQNGVSRRENPKLSRFAYLLGGSIGEAGLRLWLHRDLYPIQWPNLSRDIPRAPDDPMGSFRDLHAQVCIQTLALQEDRADIREACNNAVLESPVSRMAALNGQSDPFFNYLKEKNSTAWVDPDLLQKDSEARRLGKPTSMKFPLNVYYNEMDAKKLNRKNGSQRAAGPTEICALRDHYRRNLIYWLSFGSNAAQGQQQ